MVQKSGGSGVQNSTFGTLSVVTRGDSPDNMDIEGGDEGPSTNSSENSEIRGAIFCDEGDMDENENVEQSRSRGGSGGSLNNNDDDDDSRNEEKSAKVSSKRGRSGVSVKPKLKNADGSIVVDKGITPVSGMLSSNFGSFDLKE